jgi:acetyl-CoA carboxylase biotin carboxylase subunit
MEPTGIASVKRVLIANRGEIALRAVRACRKLGLESVAVYSVADRNSPHVWAADRSVCIGPAPSAASYLNAGALIEAARGTGCDAIYPGYGFLSENSEFAAACCKEDLVFVGPRPELIAVMGDKQEARRTAERHGVPVVPGSKQPFADGTGAERAADELGYPLLIKASAGGGGRGMRVVERADQFQASLSQASAEATAAFGRSEVYLEKFFPRVRHIEVQVLGDRRGNAVHLWERDCSIQRRYQKLVEEAPSPVLSSKARSEMTEAALSLVRALRYEGAGTIEYIYDLDSGRWFFIEMNTRIQVEHPVTEQIFDVDLVVEQLRIAAGEAISFRQPKLPSRRCAIEFRINAEDANRGFRPSPGVVTRWRPPSGQGIRLDSHVYEGYAVSPHYDSLLGKLVVSGTERGEMLASAAAALARFDVAGISTTIAFHSWLIGRQEFIDASAHTGWVEQVMLA